VETLACRHSRGNQGSTNGWLLAAGTGNAYQLERSSSATPWSLPLTKLHADFTFDRPKARYSVDGSTEKPGEYSDISAHIAQLSSFKTQAAATAELEGKLYSGDWTQAYLRAVNSQSVPQYMREYSAILPKYARDGTRLVLRIARALYGGKGSAGLWVSYVDTWHVNCGFKRSTADPRLYYYYLRRGTARITMVLATDDTIISVPHEKHFPGSHTLYLGYTAALEKDFERRMRCIWYDVASLSCHLPPVLLRRFLGGHIGELGH
jgi:hypothetical protein